MVAETVRMGWKQMIKLPPPMDKNAPDKDDLKLIRNKEIKAVAKRCQKLEESLKKGFATVYKQCSQEVKEKLKSSNEWEKTQKEQCPHKLIQKIEQICVRFDNHKQDVFNLVQVLRSLILYTQSEKEMVEEYGRNLKSLWDTVEAFGGSQGLHKGMMEAMVKDRTSLVDSVAPTKEEMARVENEANEAVKAALLISNADKQQYRKLRDELANDYLFGTDQYHNTYEKAMRILGNYWTFRNMMPYCASPNNTGVAFFQKGGKGGRGGQGRQGKAGVKKDGHGVSTDTGEGVSTMTKKLDNGPRTNSKGELHCFDCKAADHWAYECPKLTGEQQGQLQMNVEAQDDGGEAQEEGHQFLNVALA